jgi:uncharacterized protein YndB with AHSA1/START domain
VAGLTALNHMVAHGRAGLDGVFVEFVPEQRLVMTRRYLGPSGPEGGESTATVDFEAAPQGSTTLTLRHEQLESVVDAAGVQEGWRQMLEGSSSALHPEAR